MFVVTSKIAIAKGHSRYLAMSVSCSAGLHPAVSQVFNLRDAARNERLSKPKDSCYLRRSAGFKPAIQQDAILRYVTAT